MICEKCQKNEANVHITHVMPGKVEEKLHLCEECARDFPGIGPLDPESLASWGVAGKSCEFCGQPARSGAMDPRYPLYWCAGCGQEFMVILARIAESERPDLMQRFKDPMMKFFSVLKDPDFRAWSEAAHRKAAATLKEQRRQDGRDTGHV